MSKYNVRFFELVDYESLCSLFHDFDDLHASGLPDFFHSPKGEERTMEFLREILADPNSEIFIAEFNGELVGAAHVAIKKEPFSKLKKHRRYSYIESIVVKKDFRGFGVGKMLIKEIEKWSKTKDVNEIELDIWEFNKHARDYFTKDFEVLSRRLYKKI